jgi:hypothetical protein
MLCVHSPQDLTAADWATHKREIELLRSHLFHAHTPRSLYIFAEPRIIPPGVLVCWYPEPARRSLQKGGLRYQVDFPNDYGSSTVSVQHWANDRYWLTTGYIDRRGASYTRFSITRSFHELAECFATCIKTMEREQSHGAPCS